MQSGMSRWIMVGVGAVLLWACGSGPGLAVSATNAVAFDEPALRSQPLRDEGGPRKLDAGQWKHRLPLVVRNQTQRPMSNVVTMVELEIMEGMKPDIGDLRLTDEKGFEQPVIVANVREYYGFILLFGVDLPAGGKQKLFLLYGNPQADRRAHRLVHHSPERSRSGDGGSQPLRDEGGRGRLNLAYTKLNYIRNPGFEEEDPKNPQLAAGWGYWTRPLGAGTGRSTNDPCSGAVSMCLRAGTNTPGGGAFVAAGVTLSEPVRRWEHLVLAVSSKGRNMSPLRGAYASAQWPAVVGVRWPQFDYDWMTIYGLYTAPKPAAPKPAAKKDTNAVTAKPVTGKDTNAVPAKPVASEDDVMLTKGHVQVGAWLELNGTVWFDDVFLGRFASLNVEVGK